MKEKTSNSQSTANVGAQRVARVYAEALLNAAEKQDQGAAVLAELKTLLEQVFPSHPGFTILLSSAALGRRARAEVLDHIFAGRVSELFFNFLQVLNNHERLDLLQAVWLTYRELYDQRAGRVRVQVESAVRLPGDQIEELQQRLRETFHLEAVLEARVEPDLLGGLRIRIGDWLYDASVRTRLESICHQIIARSSHEIQSGRDRFCIADGN